MEHGVVGECARGDTGGKKLALGAASVNLAGAEPWRCQSLDPHFCSALKKKKGRALG